jgi:hypothetical protein
MTIVAVNTYTYSVTYLADNILKSFKDIVRLSGLDPSRLVADWEANMRALKTWLVTQDLERVILEVFDPCTDVLIVRWDIDIVYNWSGDGSFWTDTEQLKYHIRKAGIAPADATYDILLKTKPGRPNVQGWGPGSYRATDGFVRHSVGSTIEHYGLGGNAAYWRKA